MARKSYLLLLYYIFYYFLQNSSIFCKSVIQFQKSEREERIYEKSIKNICSAVIDLFNASWNSKGSCKAKYNKCGVMIGTSSDDNYGFESGEECALFFYPPHDSDYHDVAYDDCKITLSVEEGSSSLICGSSGIEVSEDFGIDNISAEIKNNSGKTLNSIVISCVFYDSQNNAIGYEYHYTNCKTDGSIDFITFDFPHDEEYETIIPSNYKIYINHAYSYDWEL